MSRITALDPGTENTAFVVLEDGKIVMKGRLPNGEILHEISNRLGWSSDTAYIEMIASYGMPVGREVFETCVWIGRFIEALKWVNVDYEFVYRKDVKLELCGSTRAKDANVRQSLIDRFGPGKGKAIGKKASPGPLYGFAGDEWAALAVAVVVEQRLMNRRKYG